MSAAAMTIGGCGILAGVTYIIYMYHLIIYVLYVYINRCYLCLYMC